MPYVVNFATLVRVDPQIPEGRKRITRIIITDGAQSDAKFRMQDQGECPSRSRSEYQSDVIERVRIREIAEGEINSLSATSHTQVDHPEAQGLGKDERTDGKVDTPEAEGRNRDRDRKGGCH